MERCLDEAAILELVEGQLDPRQAAAVDEHLARCARCRKWVSELAKTGDEPSPSGGPQLAVDDRIGRYIVRRRLGAGAMGVVYAAHDPELDREVALKLVSPARVEAGELANRKLRLQREAQAMARLKDPHVVTVHDVGEHAGQLFIAMELVEGTTLREWLYAEPRPWRDIVAALVAAGKGLAAVHGAGLVHRDFKLDNVLVGRDGRVCVTDFGLVRDANAGERASAGAVPSTEPRRPSAALPAGRRPRPSTLELTQTGAFIGTPAYMAPELLAGHPADPLSDQFSFCVALYEALYRQRPFAGTDLASLIEAIEAGAIRPPPKDSRVPQRLRRIALRGLSAARDERFPSMAALITVLARDSRMLRIALVGGATAVAAAVALLVIVHERSPGQLCAGSEASLSGVWDPSRRAAIETAFNATGRPAAADSARRVAQTFDGYTRAWTAMRTAACVATRVRGEQSDEMLSLRMACLDRRLDALHQLVAVLAKADGDVIDHAVLAARSLPSIAACADTAALLARVRPPDEPSLARQVDTLRARLASARVLDVMGKPAQGLPIARATVEAARPLSYRPLLAEALLGRGLLELHAGDPRSADRTLHEAASVAEASHHDEVAADAWIGLVETTASALHEIDEAQRNEERATAAVERLGDPARRIDLLNVVGIAREREDRSAEAIQLERQALELATREYGNDDPRVADIMSSLATSERTADQLDEALAVGRKAVTVYERALGSDHYESGEALAGVAQTLVKRGDLAEARETYERSLAILVRARGDDDELVSDALIGLALTLMHLGKPAEALAHYQHALEIDERVFGTSNANVAITLGSIGQALVLLKRYDDARRYLERALAIQLATLGHGHIETSYTYNNLGRVAREQGKYSEALAFYAEAQASLAEAVGPESADLANDLNGVGRVDLDLHRPADALVPLEHARAIYERYHVAPPFERGENLVLLSHALWDSGRDRARARELASAARELYAKSQDDASIAQIDAWLASHPAPAR